MIPYFFLKKGERYEKEDTVIIADHYNRFFDD